MGLGRGFGFLGEPDPGDHLEVIGEDRTPNITLEPLHPSTVAAIEAEGTFQSRNVCLDAGAKVLKSLVYPRTLHHVDDSKPTFLCKDYVMYCIPAV